METSFHITILIIITVACGIGAQVLAAYLKVPAIVCLLLLGIAVGQDGLELVNPDLLGSGLEVIVSLFVALILFEGGLTLSLRDLNEVSSSVRNLVTVGTLITLFGGAIASHYWGEFPWPLAFLFASLIVVTGPTVIGPLLKQVSVDRQVATILEGEGVLIDPVGAILAVLILNVVLNGDLEPLKLLADLLGRLLIGVLIGGVGGWLLATALKRSHFLSSELKNLTVLATLWGLFGLSETIRSESGLMTTVVIGLVLEASDTPELISLKRFKGQLTILAISVLFILLVADLSLASIGALGWGGLFTVLTLMWVVRPLNVFICTWQSNLNWRQKLFMAWVGPRGIVSASIASLFAILLAQRGINGGDAIKALVFLTIMMTVLIQGLTAKEMARWLGITSSELTGLMMVGANPLSCLIGKLFQANGENVVIIDSDEKACALAEKEGLPVYCNSALNQEILVEAGLSGLGTFFAITNNTEVNVVLAQSVAEKFKPPRVLAIFPSLAKPPKEGETIQQAFSDDMTLQMWNDYLADHVVKLGETELKTVGFDFQLSHLQALMRTNELIPLLLERQGRLQILAASEVWQPGDRIIYLLHDPTPKLLKRLSGLQPTVTLTLEKHPVVEEVPLLSSLLLEISDDQQLEDIEKTGDRPVLDLLEVSVNGISGDSNFEEKK